MELSFSNEENAIVMSVSGEIDHRYSIRIRNEADRRIVTYPDKRFIIDLRNVTFMDSSAIGVIIGRYKLVKRFGGSVCVVCTNSTVSRILDMSGIRKIIPIYETLDDAMSKCGNERIENK